MQIKPASSSELRRFGLLVGGIFLLIGLWPLAWRGESVRTWALVPGGALIVLGVLIPVALGPVYGIWMKIGGVLGRINTAIILSVVFFILFTPIGLIMRLKRDPMRRKLEPGETTYRVNRGARPAEHMSHQF